MKLFVTEFAKQEFDEIVSFYRQEASFIASLFIFEATHSLEIIQKFPEAGNTFYKQHQRFMIKGYPYYIVYHILGETVIVTAFAHQHRKPNYWNDRQ